MLRIKLYYDEVLFDAFWRGNAVSIRLLVCHGPTPTKTAATLMLSVPVQNDWRY